MARGHEKTLYAVDKVSSVLTASYFQSEIVKTYVFRTRKAAREFREKKNARAKCFRYSAPRPMVWGPDN